MIDLQDLFLVLVASFVSSLIAEGIWNGDVCKILLTHSRHGLRVDLSNSKLQEIEGHYW